ncbi:hypothetical protein MAPG_04864 [Magnaporthiopsis poae ATCC 64411]|uniref:Uncharacterized protein n=1 Tax=Magnaporthiopsis poae (strain ATCC 64411 / 73-15) TaxID=644358 RepID=A0A0C4DXV7_MAGP6|nr:hypothetical protein MAPG_04864 [Magnaporthiopsis poae ATCC 64411]
MERKSSDDSVRKLHRQVLRERPGLANSPISMLFLQIEKRFYKATPAVNDGTMFLVSEQDLKDLEEVLLDLWMAAESPAQFQDVDVDSPARPAVGSSAQYEVGSSARSEAGPSARREVGSSPRTEAGSSVGPEEVGSFIPHEDEADDSFMPPEDGMVDSFDPPENETVHSQAHGAPQAALAAASGQMARASTQTPRSGEGWDMSRVDLTHPNFYAHLQEESSMPLVDGLTASYDI